MQRVVDIAQKVLAYKPSSASVHRWCKLGNVDGLKLEAKKIGGRWHCTEEAFNSWIDSQNEDAGEPDPAVDAAWRCFSS